MAVPYGDGVPKIPVAPWLCATCGALAILHLETGALTATTDAYWKLVRQHNPELWQLIEETRACIRANLHVDPPPIQLAMEPLVDRLDACVEQTIGLEQPQQEDADA